MIKSCINDEYIEAYKAFMQNDKNIRNCDSCPENEGGKGQDALPCGQQHCWVSCHCKGL